jgi:hypothetical protein
MELRESAPKTECVLNICDFCTWKYIQLQKYIFDFMSLRSFHYRSLQHLTEQNITKTNRHRLGLDVVV